jgi:hypothetical protein
MSDSPENAAMQSTTSAAASATKTIVKMSAQPWLREEHCRRREEWWQKRVVDDIQMEKSPTAVNHFDGRLWRCHNPDRDGSAHCTTGTTVTGSASLECNTVEMRWQKTSIQ